LSTLIHLNLLIGISGRALLPNIAEADFATIEMALAYLHPILSAILMVGILSAVMSTVDSIVLVIGTAIAEDIYLENINPTASDQAVLRVTRITIFIVSLIVLIALLWRTPEFLAIIIYIGFAGVGIAVSPSLLMGLFWSRATKAASLSSIVISIPFYGYLITL